jgi:preprotein translocase subunit SecY
MLQAIRNAILLPEIRNRILFTLFILVIYRLASHIPVPGVNLEVLRAIQNSVETGGSGGIGALVNLIGLLSGGAVYNFSVLAMGVYPYVTASLILTLLVPVIPRLEEISKDGDSGRRRINKLTYYLTVPMAALNAIGQVNIFEQIGQGLASGAGRVMPAWGLTPVENILPTIVTILTMTAGTMFAVWLGELITEQGIGQGLSMIIFGGIISRLPGQIVRTLGGGETATNILTVVAFLVITILTILAIVYIQEGERRIPVQYGRRVRGRRMVGAAGSHIPFKVNASGMIPLIFAQALLVFPAIIAGFFVNSTDPNVASFANGVVGLFAGQQNQGTLSWQSVVYTILYFLLVIGFTYFYADVMMQQQNLPENLQKQGGFIPGIRPGKPTETFVSTVVRRLTLAGALFLGILAILPSLLSFMSYIPGLNFLQRIGGNNSLLLSGAGLLIVVGVVLDTMRQLEAQLMMRNYEGFIK